MINLYLIPTPIGNLDDMTYRSVEVLKTCDIIFSEDTRNTKVLLSYYDIKTPLKSYHLFNEEERSEEIVGLLKEGKTIAICTDAGYPGISDPGYLVCKKAIESGFVVSTLPGATASLTALVTSGIPCDKFYFYGFLAHTRSQKEIELKSMVDRKETMVFYESPHRILETLEVIDEVFGERQICIARELTKKYEEYIRGTARSILEQSFETKGEMVLIVEGAKQNSITLSLNSLSIEEHFHYYLEKDNDKKEAMKKVAKDREMSKSDVYKHLLQKGII